MLIHHAPTEMFVGTRIWPSSVTHDIRIPSDGNWDRRIAVRGVPILFDVERRRRGSNPADSLPTSLMLEFAPEVLAANEMVSRAFIVRKCERWTLGVFYLESEAEKTFHEALDPLVVDDDYQCVPQARHAYKVYFRTRKHLSLIERAVARTGVKKRMVPVRPDKDANKVWLDLDETLVGIPYWAYRDFLGNLSLGYYYNVHTIEHAFGVPVDRAQTVMDTLVAEGFIKIQKSLRHDGTPAQDTFYLAVKGQSLAAATTMRRMDRATIDKLLAAVHQRTLEVNADERFVMQFEMLGVFGSVLDEGAMDFGDLDVVFRLGYKPHWKKRQNELEKLRWTDEIMTFHVRHFPEDESVYRENRRVFAWRPDLRGAAMNRLARRPLLHVRARQSRISLNSEDYVSHLLEDGRYRLLYGERSTPREGEQ